LEEAGTTIVTKEKEIARLSAELEALRAASRRLEHDEAEAKRKAEQAARAERERREKQLQEEKAREAERLKLQQQQQQQQQEKLQQEKLRAEEEARKAKQAKEAEDRRRREELERAERERAAKAVKVVAPAPAAAPAPASASRAESESGMIRLTAAQEMELGAYARCINALLALNKEQALPTEVSKTSHDACSIEVASRSYVIWCVGVFTCRAHGLWRSCIVCAMVCFSHDSSTRWLQVRFLPCLP
jgi:DNA repair exonuclease SbcCD ATPase subunit